MVSRSRNYFMDKKIVVKNDLIYDTRTRKGIYYFPVSVCSWWISSRLRKPDGVTNFFGTWKKVKSSNQHSDFYVLKKNFESFIRPKWTWWSHQITIDIKSNRFFVRKEISDNENEGEEWNVGKFFGWEKITGTMIILGRNWSRKQWKNDIYV